MQDAIESLDPLIGNVMEAVLAGADQAVCRALELAGAPSAYVGLLGSESVLSRITAAQGLALWLRNAGDVVGALALNRFLACRAIDHASTQPLMLANLLTTVCTEAVDTGNDSLVRVQAAAWAELLQGLGETDGARQIQLCRIEAALNQGDYQAARDMLAEDAKRGEIPPALRPVRERLQGKVDSILLRPDQKAPRQNPQRILKMTLDWMASRNPGDPIITQLTNMLDEEARPNLGAAFPLPPQNVQDIIAAADGLQSARAPLQALNSVIQAIGSVLARGQTDAYAALLPAARRAIDAADRLGLWEHGCDTRWIESILLRRLALQADALARLQALGARIDDCRRRIPDPRWRAGIAVYLRHLPWVTAQLAYDRRDGAAMLHAMEAAKARILGELRSAQLAIDSPHSPQEFLSKVRAGLAAAGRRAHLLAFLSDTTADDTEPGTVGTLALLLTHDGDLLFHEIKLTPAQISAALLELDKRVRGGSRPFFSAIDPRRPEKRSFDDLIMMLSPLVDWLSPLLGPKLAKGDTLVVSPDGPIHNVSFSMLMLAGEPLIEHFAIIAIPSAALLAASTHVQRPARAVALLVPSVHERKIQGETYQEEANALRALIDVEIVPEVDQITAFTQKPRPVLLYIAAHGEASTDMPLQDRGLGMSGDASAWLTAEHVGRLELAGAHVSLRACLVGIATEITSREALGFVWALLGAGSATLVAALWAVNIESARRYMSLFHNAWLAGGQSRAEAHRTACRKLRADGGALAHPYHWAPFILTASTLSGDIA